MAHKQQYTLALTVAVLILLVGFLHFSHPARAQPEPTVTMVSVSNAGQQGNYESYGPSISADGRFVAFVSEATNLVPDDTNDAEDIFVHDRQTGEISRVSVSSAGQQADVYSEYPSISADGRFVAFVSEATNLVPDDTNDAEDIFVHDRQTGEISRVSVSSAGQQADVYSEYPSISADGRFVAFNSYATNLVPDDTNSSGDLFVHDRQTGETTRVNVSSTGQQVYADNGDYSISADGRFVAFNSWATDLVPDDTNFADDIFVHDRQTGETTRVNVSSTGQQADAEYNNVSYAPSISADGRFVTFSSAATNLVPGDTNLTYDLFVHDRQTGETTRVNVSSTGQQADYESYASSISADGQFVAFSSYATNLVLDDTNDVQDAFVYFTGITPKPAPTPTPTPVPTATPTPAPTPADTEPPTVSWVKPVGNGVVYQAASGTVALEVAASDNAAIRSVEFRLWDNKQSIVINTDSSPPYQAIVEINPLKVGRNMVIALAEDTAGNQSAENISIYRAREPGVSGCYYHTVRQGDTLSLIAYDFYLDSSRWVQIYEANKDVIGSNPNLVYPGQMLCIPDPKPAPQVCVVHYTVLAEDTLFGIAQHFYQDSSRWVIIYNANKDVIGSDPNLIFPGQNLCIPGPIIETGPGSPPSSNFPGNFIFTSYLAKDMSGEEVLHLQQLLNAFGIPVSENGPGSPGQETDYFGPKTEDAVKRFQTRYGIPATGTVDPLTREKLNELLVTTKVPGPPPGPSTIRVPQNLFFHTVDKVRFEGTATPGARVFVKRGESIYETAVRPDATWSIDGVTILEGTNEYITWAVKYGRKSKSLSYVYERGSASQQKSAATACARDIPLEIGVIGVKGVAFSYDYYEDNSIDGDPSDVEYVFQFAPNWAVDPSRLRVNTLDSLIYGLISARWSGHLSSSQSCASPVLVYADKLAVILTGGPKHWQYSFWLWYK